MRSVEDAFCGHIRILVNLESSAVGPPGGLVRFTKAKSGETVAARVRRWRDSVRGETKTPRPRIRANPPVWALPESFERTRRAFVVALDGLIDERSLSALALELREVEEEWKADHFTACALRAARCLETLVSSFARAWGLRVETPRVRWYAAVCEELDSLLLESLDAAAQTPAGMRSLAGRVARCTSELASALDPQSRPRAATRAYPRSALALLKELSGRVQAPEWRRVLSRLIGDVGPVTNILRLRNRAAHGQRSEAELREDEVRGMLNDLACVLFHLFILTQVREVRAR